MQSNAKNRFDANKRDIDELWRIHEEVAGVGAGRKHGVDVLNRAAIVFVTACWESFIEDLAVEAFDFMLSNVPSADKIPSKVRDQATKPLFEQEDSREVWKLADNGWRALLSSHRGSTLEKWLGHFHTPKTEQVDKLYEDLLGVKKLSSQWHWQGMSVASAAEKLDEYVTIRGNIAHRTAHDEAVHKNWGTDFLRHAERLVEKSEAAVNDHLMRVCKKAPW